MSNLAPPFPQKDKHGQADVSDFVISKSFLSDRFGSIARLVEQPLHMPELVGVSHDIDCFDPIAFDQQRCRLQYPVCFACDKARQAIHECRLYQFRVAALETEYRGEAPHNFNSAIEDAACGGAFSAAVGMEADVVGK